MSASDILADTQMRGDELVLKVRNSALNGRSLLTLPEFIHPHEVDELMSTFNEVSKDLVLEYNYTRVDKRTLTLQALFKPVFTKLGESQKYAHFRVCRESERAFHCESVSDVPLDIRVPDGVQPVPVRTIRVEQIDEDAGSFVVVHITMCDQVASYKNVHTVVGFLKKVLQGLCDHTAEKV
jgi:hypothetical protein